MIELDDDFDAATRELCPDGNCTGVLDADGVCKVCGARGDVPAAFAGAPATAANTEATTSVSPADEDDAADFLATREGEPTFDENRQLCPDGSCIGVLDADGRCKVCGRTIT